MTRRLGLAFTLRRCSSTLPALVDSGCASPSSSSLPALSSFSYDVEFCYGISHLAYLIKYSTSHYLPSFAL